jgi:hypothetical protein
LGRGCPHPDGALALPYGLDAAILIDAIRQASADGPPSGKKIEAALKQRGYNHSDRDGRRILEVLRPPGGNGSKPESDTEPSDTDEDEHQPAEATA